MKTFTLIAAFITLSLLANNLFSQDKTGFNSYWNNGLRIESSDDNIKIKMGGRLQYDMMFMSQNDSLDAHFTSANGVELRRARFYTSGSIYKNISFKVQIDFAANSLIVKDAYINISKIPVVGNLKVGNMKEPIGLNTLTSSKYLTFMERPITSDLDFDRKLGVMLHNQHYDKRLSWSAGVFYPTSINNKYVGNAYHLTFRLSGLPIYDVENGYKVLHLGASFSNQYLYNSTLAFASRPEAHLAPKYIKISTNNIKNMNAGNFEAALILGRFSLQGEYHLFSFQPSDTAQLNKSSYSSSSYYGTFSWFITGEHRNYSKSKSSFGMVKPKNNFGKDGWGAFELALRYSHTNFNDDDLQGGEMSNINFGVNWYLNPAVKLTLNYVHSDVPDYSGVADIVQMRFQVAF